MSMGFGVTTMKTMKTMKAKRAISRGVAMVTCAGLLGVAAFAGTSCVDRDVAKRVKGGPELAEREGGDKLRALRAGLQRQKKRAVDKAEKEARTRPMLRLAEPGGANAPMQLRRREGGEGGTPAKPVQPKGVEFKPVPQGMPTQMPGTGGERRATVAPVQK